MTQAQKAQIYDELLRESDIYQRRNSKLKSEYATNIPEHIQKEIDFNNKKISICVGKLESLMR